MSKTSKPGLIIIITPINPENITNHNFFSTFSFNNIIDNMTTKIGAKEATLWAVAKDKYLNDKTKKVVSIIDTIDLESWILIFFVL